MWVRPLTDKEGPPGGEPWVKQGYKYAVVEQGKVWNVYKTLRLAKKALRDTTSIFPPRKRSRFKPAKPLQKLPVDDFYFGFGVDD